MYIKKEIKNNPCLNDFKKKIGPDAVRFKHINDIGDRALILDIEGTICNVGLDFVDLLQDDDRVITVLTEKITNVKWLDPKCRQTCTNCHSQNCRCVELNQCTDCKSRQMLHRQTVMNGHHTVCSQCRRKPCNCKNQGMNHTNFINSNPNGRRMQQDHCPHCENNRQENQVHCPRCQNNRQKNQDHCPHCQNNRQKNQCNCPQCQNNRQNNQGLFLQCQNNQQRNQDHCPHGQNNRQNNQDHCPHCQNDRQNNQNQCPHCQDHHQNNDGCHQRFTCFCDHVIPFCDDRIELRLAELTDDVNFELLKHKGCKVKLDIS